MSAETFHDVAALADLDDPGLLGVQLPDGARICIVRFGQTVAAVQDNCPHQAMPLSAGDVHADGTIECPWHGARFDCRTGAVCQGPATDGLRVYEVRVVGQRVLVGASREP